MAHYDVHRNRRGYDGYEEPTYGARAIVGYSATVESYVAEKIVPVPVRPDQVWPRGSAHIQTKQIDEYDNSPKLIHTHGSPRGSPRKAFHGDHSPPKGHYPSKFGHHLIAPHDSPRSPKLTHTNSNGSPHDSPRKPSTGQYPVKYGGPHDSPRNNYRDNHDDDSSDDDDVECRDGVCYPKPKHGGRQGYDYDYDYDKEKKKGNGHAAGNYPLQHYSADHKPGKDLHRQASDGHKYYSTEKKPEAGNNIYGSHSYNAPAHTKPTSDAYYDRFSYPANDNEHNNTNYTHSKTEPYAVPAPIKTRPDHRDAGKSSPLSAVAHWTPFASSPRKGHQGKPEGERRYGNAPPQSADRRYHGTAAIDCEAAARKYGGVFVK